MRPATSLLRALLVIAVVLAPFSAADVLGGSFADKLKQKVKQKVEQKENQAADKVVNEADKKTTEAAKDAVDGEDEEPAEGEQAKTKEAEDATKEPAPAGRRSLAQVTTKFDFVPGDKVLFFDDFRQDEVGEFPARMRLIGGNFEVVESGGQHFLSLDGNMGDVALKGIEGLPERWTLEFDAVGGCVGSATALFELHAMSAPGAWEWIAGWGHCPSNTVNVNGPTQSHVTLPQTMDDGPHHIAFMGNGTGIKMYVNQERVANIPEMEIDPVKVLQLKFRAPGARITNVRFAEGGKPVKEQLAGGKLVTHGIFFGTGSAEVRPESAPVLRQVASALQADPALRLRITGHTDDVGAAEANLELSRSRAESVRAALVSDFGIDAGRLEFDGKGATSPMVPNTSPESRATNRRVEFQKI